MGIRTSIDATFRIPVPSTLPTNEIPAGYLSLSAVELRENDILNEWVEDYAYDPLSLYEYVLNYIDYRSHPGLTDRCRKGALGTFLEGEGNALDLSALTVYFLRKCNVPCAYGFMKEPHMKAEQVYEVYGVEFIDRSDTELYYHYNNVDKAFVFAYLDLEGEGPEWIALVPWWKQRTMIEGLELRDVLVDGLVDARGILDAYVRKDSEMDAVIDEVGSDLPNAFLPVLLRQELAAHRPDVSLDEVGVQWRLLEQKLEHWPERYAIRFNQPANDVRATATLGNGRYETVQISVRRKSDQGLMISTTRRTTTLHNRTVLLYFKPATTSDEAIVETSGGFYQAGGDPNFRMLPVLSFGETPQFGLNEVTGNATRTVRMGDRVLMGVDGGTRTLNAGNYEAYVFDLGRVTRPMLDMHYGRLQALSAFTKNTNENPNLTWDNVDARTLLGEQASTLGFHYYHVIGEARERVESWTKSRVYAYQHMGACYFNFGVNDQQTAYEADSINIDAFKGGLSSTYLWGKGSGSQGPYRDQPGQAYAQERDLFTLWGLAASAWEHGILQQVTGFEEAMSSDKDLRFAVAAGGFVTNLTAQTYSNAANRSIIRGVDTNAYGSLQQFFGAHPGGEVWFPSQAVTNGTYRGHGWIQVDVNPTDRGLWTAGFLIAGNNFGGRGPTYQQPALESTSVVQGGVVDDPISSYVPQQSLITVTPGVSINYADNNVYDSVNDYGSSFSGTSIDLLTVSASSGREISGLGFYDDVSFSSAADFFDVGINPNPGNVLGNYHTDVLGHIHDKGMLQNEPASDTRSWWDAVADPVDVRTGAFYIDEVDIEIPGPRPITLRRAYSSHYGVAGEFGFGWRFNHTAYLVLNPEGTEIRAVEPDGSVITYEKTGPNRWNALPSCNGHVANHNAAGAGGQSNPFAGTILCTEIDENTIYTLCSANGDERVYKVLSFPDRLRDRTRPYLMEWRDANSNELVYAYGEDPNRNDYGRIRDIRNARHFIKLKYDSRGQITDVRIDSGRVLRYSYNQVGDLTEVERPDGSVVRYTYQEVGGIPTHLITRITRPGGQVLENVYDDPRSRRVVSQRATVGTSAVPVQNAAFRYTGDEENGTTVVTDIHGAPTTYRFAKGRVVSITDALGGVQSNVWDASNNLVMHVTKRGTTNVYVYDARGNVTEEMEVGDITGNGVIVTSVVRRTYDSRNLLTSVTTPRGSLSRMHYDAHRNLVRQELCHSDDTPEDPWDNALYTRTVFSYDSRGWLTNRVDAVGTEDEAVTDWVYNPDGFVVEERIDPGHGQSVMHTTMRYNDRGWMTERVDGEGNTTRWVYDAMGRVVQRSSYDASAQLLQRIAHTYNEAGQRILTEGPRVSEGIDDRIQRSFDRMDRVIRYATKRYDVHIVGNHAQYTEVDDSVAQNEYDGFGNLVTAVDPNGHVVRHTFDALGRLMHATNYVGSSSIVLSDRSQGYDAGGLVVSATTPRGVTVQTRYTAKGQPHEVHYPDGGVSMWLYDVSGLVTQYVDPRQTVTRFAYDEFARLTNRAEAVGAAVARAFTYGYDRRGNRVRTTDAEGNTTEVYFDRANRIVRAIDPVGTSPRVVSSNLYDAVGRNVATFGADTYITNTYDGLGPAGSPVLVSAGGDACG